MPDTQFGPKGWTPDRISDVTGKTYVITGTTSGTGLQAARILLGKGARIVMLNRNVEKSQRTLATLRDEFGPDAEIVSVTMDLSDLSSVRRAAQDVLDNAPRIDALICNAAIAQVPTLKYTVDGFESQLGTNHYGHFVLSALLFDRIEASEGRIVVVASLGYKMGLKTIQFDDLNWEKKYSANPAYSQSKLAQMMFAYELQDRIKASGGSTGVYVCHPGSSSTSLIDTSGSALTKFIFNLMKKTPMVQSAERGAYPALMCATEDGLEQRAFYGPTGRMEFVGPVGQGTLEPYAYDKEVMVELWQVTEQNTGTVWGA